MKSITKTDKEKQSDLWTSTGLVTELDICRPISFMACLAGMSYPLPLWFLRWPRFIRVIWRYFFFVVEWTEIIMAVSIIMLFVKEAQHDIGVAIECPGSLVCLMYSFGKSGLLFRKRRQLDKLLESVHDAVQDLKDNPLANKDYMLLHQKHYFPYRKYCMIKFRVMGTAVVFMIVDQMIHGLVHPSPNTPLPMKGWFPIDHANRWQYGFASIAQFLWYLMIGFRDVFGDTAILLIIAAINVQYMHLNIILEDIITRPVEQAKPMLGWWVKAHQNIYRIMEDCKVFSGPLIFIMYGSASLLAFFLLLRLTEDPNFNILQQLGIAGIVFMHMIHLTTFSYLGDNMAANSQTLSLTIMNANLWQMDLSMRRSALIIMTRCTRPTVVQFGDNRVLSARSCGDILTGLFGYFNTLYQLRH